jgi:hydroxyethylthiazole kinase-like sugar kinase family protein
MEVVGMDLALELEEAKDQWRNAQSIYNEVSDPALLDTVIYQVLAAERRYEYLLRLAKSESLTCENIPVR